MSPTRTRGTFGLGWTLYRDLLDRPKLEISASVKRLVFGPDGSPKVAVSPNVHIEASQQLYVMMNVVNVGRRPIVWQGWGCVYHKREAHGTGFGMLTTYLPKKLGDGESHSEFTELESDLRPASDNVKRMFIWTASGKKKALSRKQLKELKKERVFAGKTSSCPRAACGRFWMRSAGRRSRSLRKLCAMLAAHKN